MPATEPKCPEDGCKHNVSGHTPRAGCTATKNHGAICPCTRSFR